MSVANAMRVKGKNSMPSFGKASLRRRATLHPKLQEILDEAIKHIDFAITCGYRGPAEQNRAYKLKMSQLTFPNSKHNKKPSYAVDIAPWYETGVHIRWKDRKGFIFLAGVISGIAAAKRIKIRWGGDFNMNNDLTDDNFIDLPHIELIE